MIKKLLLGIAAGVFLLGTTIAPAFAAGETVQYGPIFTLSPVLGSCGNNWAYAQFNRYFNFDTLPNTTGTYYVTLQFKDATFVTLSGHSPGACQAGTDNGNMVGNGVRGRFQGSFDIVVTGTYNPTAVCDMTTCNSTAGFVSTVFGSSATYITGATYFIFNYTTNTNGLWRNASANRSGYTGDITGAP